MKKKNIVFSLFLLILLSVIGAFIILKKPNDVSLRENRTLDKFNKPTISTIVDGSFQKNFENAFSDQFVLKTELYDAYTKLNNAFRNTTYIFIKKDPNDMTLYNISDKGIFSVGLDGEWLTEFPWLWSEEYNQLIEERITNYNDVIKQFPDIDFYIYKITNLRDIDWFDEANDIECAGDFYENYFLDSLDSAYLYSDNDYDSFDEYKEYNYKTDHHWNMDGAKRGYCDIIDLINDKYPQIGNPKKPINKKISNIKFYGSMAKTSNYNVDNNNFDLIGDYIYDLGTYKIFVNGEQVTKYGNREMYFNNEADDSKEINHYREFFGADTYEKIYDYGNNTGVNILVISDSYSNCIEPVLASHFNKSFFYDLRHTPEEGFDIKKTIEKNDIDIVLYLGSFFDIFMDGCYIVPLV